MQNPIAGGGQAVPNNQFDSFSVPGIAARSVWGWVTALSVQADRQGDASTAPPWAPAHC